MIARDRDTDGFVITYQQLIDNETRRLVERVVKGSRQTLTAFDECHHMSDGKNWGQNCKFAFGKCHRRILLSGTPVRADNDAIPFVTYRDGVAIADFTFGYKDALSDGVVPPIFFPTFGGNATWKVGDEEIQSFGRDLTQVDQTRKLNTMIDSADWLKASFRAANDRLTDLKEHQSDAAGLIVCRDQRHAKKMHRIASQYSADVKLAISDDDAAHDTIRNFREGDGRWLTTVRMVSEGVDIPRLRVGLYATNYRAELFFRQVVGRLVRIVPGLVDQSAFLYLPDHPDLVGFARDMSIDRTHVIKESSGPTSNRLGNSIGKLFAGGSVDVVEGVTVLPGSEFDEAELARAAAVRNSAGLGYLPLEVVASLLRANEAGCA